MSDDSEVELWRRRRLLEMRRRLLEKEESMREEAEREKEKSREEAGLKPKEVLKKMFVERAWEVWNAAEAQYPTVTERIAVALASLIEAGKIGGSITGEQLYWFFRQLGLDVRLKTKIRIYESGELKTIADKLREK